MPLASDARTSFDAGISPARDPLAAAAASLAADADAKAAPGTLIIAVRPHARDYRVIAAEQGNGALRAAVSVMVASENVRLWHDLDHRGVADYTITALPEVVRAAAEGASATTVHVGVVRPEHQVGAVVFWFSDEGGTIDAGSRAHTIDVLDVAARRYLEMAEELAAERRAECATSGQDDETDETDTSSSPGTDLVIGSDDPDLDALTGLASKQRFDTVLDEFEGDEATLLLIDLDHFTRINDEHGTDVGDQVLQEIARRLAGVCRKTDLVARLGSDEFAVVLDGADRHTGLETSKRLLKAIAVPLPPDLGPESIDATVAFAHEFGLVDMEELLETADTAVASGKRTGRGRIVIAS